MYLKDFIVFRMIVELVLGKYYKYWLGSFVPI